MVDISLSGSGEGPGWATAPGYSTAVFLSDGQAPHYDSCTGDRRLGSTGGGKG